MEHEGLAMIYVLEKFKHYLLGTHFKIYIDHSALKYLVKKHVLGGGGICRWLLLFQEHDFEVVVKLGRSNAELDHVSQIENGDKPTSLDEGLPNEQFFFLCML